jgi:biopolymer transport protein ExbD
MQANATASDAPQINTTPLIDVMLVLLVMLIITLPIATHSVRLDLPSGHPPPRPERPIINLDIDFDGRVFWNGTDANSGDRLERWLRQAAQSDVAPIVKVWPDRRAPYGRVAQVLAAAQRARLRDLAVAPVAD